MDIRIVDQQTGKCNMESKSDKKAGENMYCLKCGNEIPDGKKFCSNCGSQASSAPTKENPRLDRNSEGLNGIASASTFLGRFFLRILIWGTLGTLCCTFIGVCYLRNEVRRDRQKDWAAREEAAREKAAREEAELADERWWGEHMADPGLHDQWQDYQYGLRQAGSKVRPSMKEYYMFKGGRRALPLPKQWKEPLEPPTDYSKQTDAAIAEELGRDAVLKEKK